MTVEPTDEKEVSILDKLKAPFPSIHFRPKTCNNGKVLLLAYIDSRDVMKRLDDVFGLNWSCDYKEVKGNLYCGIKIHLDGRSVTKWDCGTESNMDKEKGESSDAFKRAAVKFGIGRYLYYLPVLFTKIDGTGENYINIQDKKTKQWVSGYYNSPVLPKWAYPKEIKKDK